MRRSAPDSDPAVAALYDPAPVAVPPTLAGALGIRRTLADLTLTAASTLDALDRLCSERRTLSPHEATRIYCALVPALLPLDDAPLPERIRTARGVCDPADAVVVDAFDLMPLVGDRGVVPVPVQLAADAAEVLGVEPATALASYGVVTTPTGTTAWRDVPRIALAVERAAAAVPDAAVAWHHRLAVRDVDGVEREVGWRAIADVDHVASGDRRALARALAARLGRWDLRQALAEALDPAYAEDELRADDALGWAPGA